jgi:plasmid maintenance system killer protein
MRHRRLRRRETGQGILLDLNDPARLKLGRLETVTSLRTFVALPGDRFAALVGDRKGQFSIRNLTINRGCLLRVSWSSAGVIERGNR